MSLPPTISSSRPFSTPQSAALAVEGEADLVPQAGGEQLAVARAEAARRQLRQVVASDHGPDGRRRVGVAGASTLLALPMLT